jgi:hypothetical protein
VRTDQRGSNAESAGVGFGLKDRWRATRMTMRDALVQAMHLPSDSDTFRQLHANGLAVADEDTMSRAIHDVYCGITADHEHPSEKDHAQARAMIEALQKVAVTQQA